MRLAKASFVKAATLVDIAVHVDFATLHLHVGFHALRAPRSSERRAGGVNESHVFAHFAHSRESAERIEL